MYTDLLERAVNALKSGKQPELDTPMDRGAEVDLQTAALIPEDYLPDIQARLVFVQAHSQRRNASRFTRIAGRNDRPFCLLPEPVKTLFSVAE